MAETAKERVEAEVAERRKAIGQESEPRPALYPIEHEAVARFVTASDDTNPLFIDPEYGAGSSFGANLAPGLGLQFGLLRRQAPAGGGGGRAGGMGPGAGGRRAINLGTEWEFFKPIKVGDRIFTSSRLADVYIKPIRIDPLAVWTKSETIYRNQDGDIVAIQTNLGISHRTPEEVAAEDTSGREARAATAS